MLQLFQIDRWLRDDFIVHTLPALPNHVQTTPAYPSLSAAGRITSLIIRGIAAGRRAFRSTWSNRRFEAAVNEIRERPLG